MHHYLYPPHLNIKQPPGFDHLQPFVKQRRGINRYLPPHHPRRMFQRALDGDARKFRLRRGARNGPAQRPSAKDCALRRRAFRRGIEKLRNVHCRRPAPERHASALSRITISPAITRISLEATAMSLPARMAASAGCNPAVPTIAIKTISAEGSVASLINPFRAAMHLRGFFPALPLPPSLFPGH